MEMAELFGITAGVFGIFTIILSLGLVLLGLALVVVMVIGQYKTYKKAGRAGWEALVPIYNLWVLVEIAGLKWWWFLILIGSSLLTSIYIGTIGVWICYFCIFYNISKKLHQDIWMPIVGIFLPGVLFLMIGFGKKYEFDNNVIVTENGPFDANKGNNNNNSNMNNQNNNTTNFKDGTGEINYCPNCGNKVTGSNFCINCGTKIK